MNRAKIVNSEVHIESQFPDLAIAEIKEAKDIEMPPLGMVRAYCYHYPNGILLQMRVKNPLTREGQPRNLLASANLDIEELRTIVDKFTVTTRTCQNCKHWRDKAWTGESDDLKGIGICDNPKVDVRPRAKALLASQGVEDWAVTEILQSVRFPHDFGCLHFEPID